MEWEHRVLEREDGSVVFVEAFYDNGNPVPHSYSSPYIIGDDVGGLKEVVEQLGKALTLPILSYRDFN
jgi:hypothetical protein